ncbi:hypothetical protein QQ045_010743 [Rhodiola kirilowii]
MFEFGFDLNIFNVYTQSNLADISEIEDWLKDFGSHFVLVDLDICLIFPADAEEVKAQENSKLQLALQQMELQFSETKTLLRKECEYVKALVGLLEKKIDEMEKKFEDVKKISEESLKQAADAESKMIELKKSMQRCRKELRNSSLIDSTWMALYRMRRTQISVVDFPIDCRGGSGRS